MAARLVLREGGEEWLIDGRGRLGILVVIIVKFAENNEQKSVLAARPYCVFFFFYYNQVQSLETPDAIDSEIGRERTRDGGTISVL